MKIRSQAIATCIFLFVALSAMSLAFGQQPEGNMAFTVTMEKPETHYYHVDFRCDGLKSSVQDFKMPVWTPGYYGILNNAKTVENFVAKDGSGNQLKWEQTTKNTWRVQSDQAASITVSYDVKATTQFIANSYLDENRGYISPAGVFMYIAGQIQHPVTVVVQLYPKWSTVATGLDPIAERPHAYSAPNFDVLYDCPILMGNLETLPAFEVQGIPHTFVGYNLGSFDREEFIGDLKRMVQAGVSIVGEIPYKHYTFLAVGPGMGGIEHSNSAALSFSGRDVNRSSGRKGWLTFIAHEYFHLYNVKAIRPIALGPFDYDTENYTNMLWFSEGGTVYYEYIILNRAGFMNRQDVLDALRKALMAYENKPGHLYQSATQASYQTWAEPPFGRRQESINKTISYYDKGAVLCALLDLKIRQETKNQKSLDSVMRTLYQKFYKEKNRGFTDEEFRGICENTAGCPLAEFFEYASTVKDIDYPKYFAYAGLEIEMPRELPEPNSGIAVQDTDGKLMISKVDGDSPAQRANLEPGDEIKSLDGNHIDAQACNDLLASKKPDDTIRLVISHDNKDRQVELVLGHKMERSFRLKPISNPDELQSTIFNSWLKE